MLNQCNFIGRLGRDPETKYAQSGDAICNFSVACSERWKDKNGDQQEKTEWINVVMWGKLGEIAGKYLQKGSLCYISGKMATRKWEDKDGNPRYTTEIIGKELKLLSPRSEGSNGASGYNDQEPPGRQMGSGDDVPF